MTAGKKLTKKQSELLGRIAHYNDLTGCAYETRAMVTAWSLEDWGLITAERHNGRLLCVANSAGRTILDLTIIGAEAPVSTSIPEESAVNAKPEQPAEMPAVERIGLNQCLPVGRTHDEQDAKEKRLGDLENRLSEALNRIAALESKLARMEHNACGYDNPDIYNALFDD